MEKMQQDAREAATKHRQKCLQLEASLELKVLCMSAIVIRSSELVDHNDIMCYTGSAGCSPCEGVFTGDSSSQLTFE